MLFIAISFLGLREAVVRVIPVSLKHAVTAGIGLFIALLGAKGCGLIVANEAKGNLAFGDLTSAEVIVCVIGFVILLVMKVLNVPGGMILTILATTLVGIPFGVTQMPESIVSLPADISGQFLNVDFLGALNFAYIPAFICVTFTIFANNIANGICTALPAYLIMKIAAGKVRKVSPVMYVLVAVCLLYFYTLV